MTEREEQTFVPNHDLLVKALENQIAIMKSLRTHSGVERQEFKARIAETTALLDSME